MNDDLWTTSTEFPDELNPSGNGFSVDVLIYDIISEEHTIGWFDFEIMTWRFLSNENIQKFFWRYLSQEIDKPKTDGM